MDACFEARACPRRISSEKERSSTYEKDGAEKEKVVLDEFHVGVIEKLRGSEYRCALTSSRVSSYAVALYVKHQANRERNMASTESIYMSSRRRGENKRESDREKLAFPNLFVSF